MRTSTNVIVAGLPERASYPICFGIFLKYWLIITMAPLLIAAVYIWLHYLRLLGSGAATSTLDTQSGGG